MEFLHQQQLPGGPQNNAVREVNHRSTVAAARLNFDLKLAKTPWRQGATHLGCPQAYLLWHLFLKYQSLPLQEKKSVQSRQKQNNLLQGGTESRVENRIKDPVPGPQHVF